MDDIFKRLLLNVPHSPEKKMANDRFEQMLQESSSEYPGLTYRGRRFDEKGNEIGEARGLKPDDRESMVATPEQSQAHPHQLKALDLLNKYKDRFNEEKEYGDVANAYLHNVAEKGQPSPEDEKNLIGVGGWAGTAQGPLSELLTTSGGQLYGKLMDASQKSGLNPSEKDEYGFQDSPLLFKSNPKKFQQLVNMLKKK